jgi:hypothetical protein
MPDLPGKARGQSGLLAWLGRQVGYVSRAIKTDVVKKTVYRNDTVEELPHPEDPNLKLRRRVIDEVIVEKPRRPDQ